MSPAALFAGASTALVAAAVLAGVTLLGSPSDQRSLRLDEERVRDLMAISGVAERYLRGHDALPDSLAELTRGEQWSVTRSRDPETQEPYTYRVTGPSSYELCAGFANPLAAAAAEEMRLSAFWQHPAGRHCFAFDAALPRR